MPEKPLSDLAVYSARPTVRVDSKEQQMVSELVLAMEMREREGGMSALELRLSNVASNPEGGALLAFEDDRLLKLGAKIAVYCGDENAPREIFQGVITGLEADFPDSAPPELVVLAEDVFQQARMARRTKIHESATLSALASELASQLNLTPVITGFTESIGTQVQLNESDLAFFRRMLARYDGDIQVVGTEMHVSPRADVSRGELELALHGQLRSARASADLAHQVSKITVSGWDPVEGSRVKATSSGANISPGSGRSGSQILGNAIGERSEHIGHLAVTTTKEAQALADTAFDSRARRFVNVCATAEGNAALRVGTRVKLAGMGGRFDNTYYVTSACHRFDVKRGYETEFEAESAYLGAA
jgi:phage protein D